MKSRYLLLAGIAVMACLAGCSDNSLDNGMAKNPVQEGEEILFGSSLSDEVESRTVYGDRDENGVAVHWVDGDEIAIFCKETSQPANHLVNYKIKPNAGDPSKASEVMKVDPNAAGLQWGKDELHHFYAFYPASAVHGAESDDQQGTITASIPVNQQPAGWRTGPIVSQDESVNGHTTTFALPNMDYAYMYASNAVDRNTVESGSGTIWLQFHNLVTVLDITIPAPKDGSDVIVTDVTVRAVDGSNTVLTGDFNCYIRGAGETTTPACEPVGDMGQVRNVVNIPCFDQKTGKFITLGDDEDFLNVKAYIIPDNVNDAIQPRTLQISVSTLNGGEKKRTLHQASIVPHKVNRVLLPAVVPGGTNYWMSDLDPNIYVSELSIPGSKFSVLSSAYNASNIYQNATIEQQFQDGIRAFIFQTSAKGSNTDGGLTPSKNTFSGDIKVVSEGADKEVMSLEDAVKEIASYLDKCEQAQKMNEFAFLMLTYATGGSSDNGTGYWGGLGNPGWHWDREPRNAEQTWINLLRDKVNELAAEPKNRIYTGEITPNTTIEDLGGHIIIKVNYNSEKMLNYYTDPKSFVYNGPDVKTSAPMMFTYWGFATGPVKGEWTYQDENGGMPMDWGVPVWYANSTAQLKWYYQEVTSVGTDQEATKQQKEDGIKHLFQESVDLYKNDNSHKTWFMNDLGGYYSDNGNINGRGTGIEALAIDMNNLGVQELQKRTENAGLGLIFMNFADKQTTSGVKYKSDYLIQTIIMNNRKFQLRKKASSEGGEGTKSYDASYNNGGNAIGWDK